MLSHKKTSKIKTVFIWILFLATTIGVLILDWNTVYMLQNRAWNNESDNVNIIATIGILLMLDGIPVLLTKFIKTTRRRMQIFCIVMLVLIFGGMLSLFVPQRLYYTGLDTAGGQTFESDEWTFDETESDAEEEPKKDTSENFQFFSNALLGLLPFATSAVSLTVSVIHSEYLMYRKADALEEEIHELEAELLTLHNIKKNENFQKIINENFSNALRQVNAMNLEMKVYVRREFAAVSDDANVANFIASNPVPIAPALSSLEIRNVIPAQAFAQTSGQTAPQTKQEPPPQPAPMPDIDPQPIKPQSAFDELYEEDD